MSNNNNKKPSTAKKLIVGYVSTVSGYGLLSTTVERISGIFGVYGRVFKKLLGSKDHEAADQPSDEIPDLLEYQGRYRNAQRTALIGAAFFGYSAWVLVSSIHNPVNLTWSIGCAMIALATYLVAAKELCAFRLSKKLRKKTFLTWKGFMSEVAANPANILPLSNNNNNKKRA